MLSDDDRKMAETICGVPIPPPHTHTHTNKHKDTQTHARHKWFYILSHAMYCIGQTKIHVHFCEDIKVYKEIA